MRDIRGRELIFKPSSGSHRQHEQRHRIAHVPRPCGGSYGKNPKDRTAGHYSRNRVEHET